jgi:serine/threonine protein kinase
VQQDAISPEELLATLRACKEKTQPLGQLLVERGFVDSARLAALETQVQERLVQHENDPQQTLSSLKPVASLVDELKQLADPDLNASLAYLPTLTPPAVGPLPTKDPAPSTADPAVRPNLSAMSTLSKREESSVSAVPAVGTPTSSGLRFLLLRPHARGGLGQVSVALDEELHREVALKEIQDRHADNPEVRARFLLEAEITGGLEHPGIVPVYGLGHDALGRPFYAMRFIRGNSLQEAIKRFHQADRASRPAGERALAFRKLLGRFVAVCNAIAYAHSRGVLHRDLKPGNIMLGKYGETLVVDWGLAKTVEQPEANRSEGESLLVPFSGNSGSATQMGSTLGTPAYMSPEQAAGRLDLLGPASDIYSLGATLYCLLTGTPPFQEKNLADLLRQLEAGKVVPPRQINKEVPPAL